MDAASPRPADYWRAQVERALLAPVRAMRRQYLPLLMVYFAYGAMGLTAVAEAFWVKKGLTWTPAELSALAVWLTLPWTVKMVFGELVDTVPILGSQRRVYVFIGAGMIATSFVLLSGAAGGWITLLRPDKLYIVAALLSVTGLVVQDVVADAMSTEVVARTNPDGSPRPKAEIDHDLGMVQVLGRLALSFGIFAVAGLSGWLAQWLSYQTVFLLGLLVPLISVSGAILVRLETSEQRPTDWRILGGGIVFGAFVVALALSGIDFSQEIVWVVSMTVVIWMLSRVTSEIDHTTRMRIVYAAIIIFAFRATPGVGEGFRWFEIDVLGFDEAFFGMPAAARRRHRHRRHLVPLRLHHAQAGSHRAALDHHFGHAVGPAERCPGLSPGPRHRAAVRSRCARHRPHRRGRRVAPRAPQHHSAAHSHCRLCAVWASRHVVRAHGLAHEPGADCRSAGDQVSEPDLPRGPWRVRSPADACRCRHRDQPRATAVGNSGLRPPRAMRSVAVRPSMLSHPRNSVS